MFTCTHDHTKLPPREPLTALDATAKNTLDDHSASQDQSILLELEQILDELYQLAGNFTRPKPTIGLSDTLFRVASYDPQRNHINVERPAIKVCEEFKGAYKSALALIIGHELGHFLFSTKSQKNQNADFLCANTEEQQADILGVFLAYLARNEHLDELVPRFIEKIYHLYKHAGKSRTGKYQPLAVRKQAAESVKQKAAQLRLCFVAGNYLTAAGQYEQALDCYQFIEPYYKAREIAINQGVCKLLLAKSIANDGYLYPLHFISETQLDIIKFFDPASDRKRLLNQAIGHFEAAKYFKGGSDFAADINILCTLILVEDLGQANVLIQNLLQKNLDANERTAVQFAQALASIKSDVEGSHTLGLESLKNMAKDSSKLLFAKMAQFNLLKYEQPKPGPRSPFSKDQCNSDSKIEPILKDAFRSMPEPFSLNLKRSISADTINDCVFIELSTSRGAELRLGYSLRPQTKLLEENGKDISYSMLSQHKALLSNRNPACPAVYEIELSRRPKKLMKTIWLHWL